MGLMEGNGLSVADAIALQDNDRNDGMFGGNGMWVFFLFFLLAWGNGGLGSFGNNRGAALEGALTRADLCQDMNFQSLENAVRGIQNGICDGFYAMNTGMLNGFNGVDNALCQGFNGVNAAINQARFDAQQCCCETNRNIDAVRYENAKNTCDITTNANYNTRDIIEAQNAGVQRIIDHLNASEVQGLRDQLQTANFQLSQQAQSANLINQLRPCPVPAYPSCSPYASFPMNNCGCGCGF